MLNQPDDLAYYTERLEAEDRLARESTNPDARIKHRELAAHYRALIRAHVPSSVAPIPAQVGVNPLIST